ncbi:protein YcfR [Klebsiella pneumoniae]|uniref:Protein YcfR n=1 Tax=Klebsiella pneumoniae TaxID=573 RepID=A0A2X3CPX8_KLEPN|nr:protein YcfR [Klebsiella pneumoniae]
MSFGAFAADIINSEQAQGREAIGTVSVGAVASSPMDMHEMLNKKAQEEGASSYRIIEAALATTGMPLLSCINKF